MDCLHAGWQKNYSHTHRRNTEGVCDHILSPEGHFITPELSSLIVDEFIGLGNDCYTLGYELFPSAENSQILSHNFFRTLSACNNSGVVNLCYQSVHKKFSTWINFFDTRSLRQNLIAGH
jgi:hypothetical protein